MTQDELSLVLQWAANEGWNPGTDDAAAFFNADPDGFLLGYDQGKPVSAISVIKQDDKNGFLGLYLCHPEYRGKGHGWAIWQAGIAHLDGLTIGLDGVVEQQDNYRRSGFELVYRNRRYTGTLAHQPEQAASTDNVIHRPIEADDLAGLIDMDEKIHSVHRSHFLKSWLQNTTTRKSLVSVDGSQLTGFGTIRACQQGYKIGPLIAPNAEQARNLLFALTDLMNAKEIILDVPEPNSAAVALAEELQLENVFETARMYKGHVPAYKLDKLFGVSTFELG